MYPSDDKKAVLRTAERLGISEFQVFSAAYHAWFQEHAPVASLERHFVAYLFDGCVPFWVRHFTRSTTMESATAGPVHRGVGHVCVGIVDFVHLVLALLAYQPARLQVLPPTHRLIA